MFIIEACTNPCKERAQTRTLNKRSESCKKQFIKLISTSQEEKLPLSSFRKISHGTLQKKESEILSLHEIVSHQKIKEAGSSRLVKYRTGRKDSNKWIGIQ